MKFLNPFRRQTPEQNRQRQLMRQWCSSRQFDPLVLLLRRVVRPRCLAVIAAAAKNERMGLWRVRQRRLRRTRKKNRDRKNLANAAKRSAPLPPPLPYSANAFPDPTATLDSNSNAVPVPVAGAPIVAAPLFVLWSQKLLEKPARLLTKIADRIRCWSLMKRVRKLGLTPDQEKEIAADLKWKDEVTADFNAALAECATVELNKHRVSGSQNAHWVNRAMSGGEMGWKRWRAWAARKILSCSRPRSIRATITGTSGPR